MHYGSSQLKAFTRQEVREARRKGIAVTGVVISGKYHAISDPDMKFMFGHKRHWKRMSEDRFGQDLIRLVTTSFMNYLRHG